MHLNDLLGSFHTQKKNLLRLISQRPVHQQISRDELTEGHTVVLNDIINVV